MHPFVFSLTLKLGLITLSTAIGMGGFLLFHSPKPAQAEMNSFSKVRNATYWREELSIKVVPTLLARTDRPVDLAGDALDVLYILEKGGNIIRIAPGTQSLAVSTQFARLADEKTHPGVGFSALALHPDFHIKESPGFGKFYVAVAEKPGTALPDFVPEFGSDHVHHQDVVYEYRVDSPLLANLTGTRREVLRFNQPGPDHNLTSLTFDHKGFLYLAVGDGASGTVARKSPSKNASSLTSAYGKVLRIEPLGQNSRNGKYGVPETNPFFLVTQAIPELWAFGLRSPHSLSFDPFLQSLYFGETALDGTDRVCHSNFGGEHYGWDLDQGSFLANFSIRNELEEIVTPPLLSIERSSGQIDKNIGSIIYRGESFPSLAGRLVYASRDGQIIVHSLNSHESYQSEPVSLDLGPSGNKAVRALRSTPRGELVLLCEDGSVIALAKGKTEGLEKSATKSLYCLLSASLQLGDQG